ncbi:hypothetical protein DYB37_010164 [Aphanomyces astaci]|uniref:Peptidase S1 domain-containing protein n=1 Tax=Aphanomyces astaci TaxID=112090 RepID=A0A3R7C9K9_APHAT|nr:hypothetical protein DYB37_010164 [Aphanomyces astaci]
MQKLVWPAAVAAITALVVNAHLAGFQNAKMTTYMAQLRVSAEAPMICQGILIDANFALFTRACTKLYEEDFKGSMVLVGASRFNGEPDDGEWIRVHKYYYCPDHAMDLAMVQFARPSNYTPVQILWNDVVPGMVVWLRGWFLANSDKSLNRLVETTVQVTPNGECQVKHNRNIYDHQVCGDNDSINKCSSFILGSLITEIRGRDFLVGTLTTGNCESKPVYEVFTRLSASRSFIEPFLCNGA